MATKQPTVIYSIPKQVTLNFLGRTAFIGVGFSDRSDSFDLNVALQDHFKWIKKSEEIEKEKVEPKPELDLRFKEGETIKINMKITVRFSFTYPKQQTIFCLCMLSYRYVALELQNLWTKLQVPSKNSNQT